MSDVEKAISGLVEDEELLQLQQQKQQHELLSTPLNKTNISNYTLQNKTGNTTLLQKQRNSLSTTATTKHHQLLPQNSSNSNVANTRITGNNSKYLTTQQYNCLSRLAKLIFSTPGLVIMVVVYTIMGAFLFPLLEAPQDISKSALIAKSREECLKELWIITEKLNVLYERNWTILVHEQLRRFEGTIVAATRNMAANGIGSATSSATSGAYAGMSTDTTSTTTTALGRYGNNNLAEYSDLTATRWSFSEALLYSVTVITTIGHGSLTPRTAGGKIATIFYALIGVPLMLMCLSSLGALLAEALQCTYARLCCRWPQYAVNSGNDLNDEMLSSHTKKHQQKPSTKTNISRDMMILEKEEAHHEFKKSLHSCDFQEHQNSINCKNCKYDAIIGETNTNGSYDYKLCNDATTTTATSSSLSPSVPLSGATAAGAAVTTSAMTTMKLGHKEDCCQLLQNSPGKFTQHLSSCMQLKMSPTKAVGSSGDTAATTMPAGQATTAKQYYQQRPDVMLMTTGHKLSSQQPVTTMAAACRMVLPTTASPATQQRFYHTSTPAMATYHIVSSASANSSPTHQQSIRHYIVPPPLPPPTSSSSSSSSTVTQHFMAVPTNMLRFHHETSLPQHQHQQQQYQQYGNIVNTTTNINPLTLPVSGSATVYFPIVTPTTVATQNTSLTAVPLGAAGISQPLIKYHTLQIPHKRQQNIMMLQQTAIQDNQIISNTETSVDAEAEATAQFPPPPPPAYQTATVHGIRRAKFLTKPLPPEINTLLQESDISCRHDLSPHLQTFSTASVNAVGGCVSEQQQMSHTTLMATATSTTGHAPTSTISNCNILAAEKTRDDKETETSMTTTAVTTNFSSFYDGNSSKINHFTSPSTNSNHATETSTTATIIYENHESQTKEDQLLQDIQDSIRAVGEATDGRHATAVDIMEDEEEHEQQRLSNCPHGTPSRVPLLNSSSSTSDDKSHTRSFLNATAASFHRHTLNTFQKTNIPQRKSIIINHKGECNLHIPKRRNSTSATVCYTDPYDDMLTSDDDCGILEGKNVYKLKHLQQTNVQTDNKPLVQEDFYDNNSLVSLDESTAQIPQVPIIVVLLILIFYISLGTVIFALWENWSLIDGAYFCFVTLTTIGYGDFMPLHTFQGPEIQLFACCAYLLLGLVLVAMSFSILETQLIWKCKRLAVRLKLAKE